LYGRRREIETLFALIARAKEHGDALVIRGEPGIGKSAILAAASARRSRVASAIRKESGGAELALPNAASNALR